MALSPLLGRVIRKDVGERKDRLEQSWDQKVYRSRAQLYKGCWNAVRTVSENPPKSVFPLPNVIQRGKCRRPNLSCHYSICIPTTHTHTQTRTLSLYLVAVSSTRVNSYALAMGIDNKSFVGFSTLTHFRRQDSTCRAPAKSWKTRAPLDVA